VAGPWSSLSTGMKVVVVVGALWLLGLMFQSAGLGKAPVSACEQQWIDNRASAESPYMTHSLYVRNCEESAKFLTDLRRELDR
jgi:hypothetical protein